MFLLNYFHTPHRCLGHSVDNYELWVPLCGVVVLTAETCLATDIATILKLKLVTSL